MASLTQHSIGAYCLRSKKSSININTTTATATLDAKSHKASTTTFQLPLTIEKMASITISNVNGKKRKDEQWRVFGSDDDGSCGIAPIPAPPSVAELAKDFYNAINSKDISKLDPLLADNCQYQDLVFYVPFEGKKQGVIPFFAKMMEAMGPNIVFVIDNVTEGAKLTASVIWHLEWKHKVIPFATGCTFFEYEEYNDGRLLLRKATGMAEIPFKPGDFVLKVLKSASTFFDLYPMAADALLKSHEDEPHEGLSSLLDKLFGKR
ncbi:putative NTF2-like domain-containing protein [Rosa chinensis]|uniref:Putative NTF2-like domain-containing protein n=1 Tax=Rosa chinensis TaxID=74649 RepID=A0A2P6PSC9_ROSCH|nr:uncharacterized protein LOC112174176 [Rosa chinensis]PRQ24824.1 putative NTF2-like domain-containing protein [Rosa chinensis]